MNFRRTGMRVAAKRTGMRVAATAALTLGIGLVSAAPSFAVHQTVTGLTTTDALVQFAVGSPGTLLSGPTAIGGAAVGNLVGIDYRPRTNTLYGVNDAGQVFLIVPNNAAAPSEPTTSWTATAIGTPGVDPANVDSGLDFNPVPDAIRLVNTDDQNLRLSPNTGGLLGTDGPLAFAAADLNAGDNPAVGAAAYSNNFDGTTATTLFDIEALNDALVIQNPPNSGTLNTVGTLPGGDITSIAGFDIETQTGNAYTALQTTGDTSSIFYRLDLATGAALNTFGPIAGGQLIEGVTLPPVPVLQFANAVTSVAEGDQTTVTVNRQGPLNQQATVNYATELAAGDSAQAEDFTAATGTLTFAPGDAQEAFMVPTTDDTINESDETLTVRMSMPSRSANLAAPPTSKVNIVDNDDAAVVPGKPGAAPIGLISVQSQKIGKKLKAKFSCDEACTAKLNLKLGAKKFDSQTATQSADNAVNDVVFKLSKSEVKKAKKKAKGKKVGKFSITGTFTDADGSTTSKVKFQLG